MITNIIDERARPHRWKKVNAVVEPTWHDNTVMDADEATAGDDDIVVEKLAGASLAEAVVWAQGFDGQITLYLYDEGDGFAAGD